MHNDETLWQCLNNDYCSYKVQVGGIKGSATNGKQNFCRNQYNVTGLCNRVSCPLANGRYATVLEEEGVCYLHIKTIERAHSPKNLWEKVKLSRNFLEALKQIDEQLKYWPEHMINRCKQRLTKMRQMLIRMRKQSMKEGGPRLVPIKKKTERREKTREIKAEAAAKVDLAIEKELLERLKQGTYGDIYNFPKKQFDQALDKENEEIAEEEDEEETEFVEDLDDEDDEEELDGEEDFDLEEDEEPIQDLEDLDSGVRVPSQPPPRKKRRAAPHVELEYEEEMEAR